MLRNNRGLPHVTTTHTPHAPAMGMHHYWSSTSATLGQDTPLLRQQHAHAAAAAAATRVRTTSGSGRSSDEEDGDGSAAVPWGLLRPLGVDELEGGAGGRLERRRYWELAVLSTVSGRRRQASALSLPCTAFITSPPPPPPPHHTAA